VLLQQLQIKHFRCFSSQEFTIQAPLVLIEGLNGSGKSSLLEALHYLCYLRSFRTAIPRELLHFGHDTFFLKAVVALEGHAHEIQVGFSGKKRLVKIDNKTVNSYKDLLHYYRVITVTEDDLALIHGGPQERRSFIDQAVLLNSPDVAPLLRSLRHTIESRNRALQSGIRDADYHTVLSEQLWELSSQVQQLRIAALAQIEQIARELLGLYEGEITITCHYAPKHASSSYADFSAEFPQLLEQELRYGRCLFGAHLDDIVINIKDKKSKQYASRGQQKLVVLLLKIAQIKQLLANQGPVLFLLDDFMTDFDQVRAERILTMLTGLPIQLIFTVPTSPTVLGAWLRDRGAQVIKLTH